MEPQRTTEASYNTKVIYGVSWWTVDVSIMPNIQADEQIAKHSLLSFLQILEDA